MKQFLSDIFTERRGGKTSSKKFWGHIIMLLVAAAFVLDGLHWYEANKTLFGYMLIAGCTLIGLRTAKDIFKGLFGKGSSPDEKK